MAEDFSPILRDILFDPQTSGGLLIGCAENEATALRNRLRDGGVEYAEIIGYANEKTDEKIELQ